MYEPQDSLTYYVDADTGSRLMLFKNTSIRPPIGGFVVLDSHKYRVVDYLGEPATSNECYLVRPVDLALRW